MDDSKAVMIIEHHTVPPLNEKVRLSDYAIDLFDTYPTRKSIKKAIKKGLVLVDGEPGETGTWVRPGQRIELLEAGLPDLTPYPIDLNVLFEDPWMAVVEKPPGLATSGPHYRTLENALSVNLSPSTRSDALPLPRVAHRLDARTRGLVLVGKTRSARAQLGLQFETGEIRKQYECLAMGSCPSQGFININLDGKSAKTSFKLINEVPSLKSGHLAHLALFPETGRTHQLRRHLSMIGHPILGDKLYGVQGKILKGKGLFLAAVGLEFNHPGQNEILSFSLKTPVKFKSRMVNEERRWKKYNE